MSYFLYFTFFNVTVDCCDNTPDLSEGQHSSMERVSGIIAHLLVAKHQRSMVNAHGKFGIGLLEYSHKLDYVGTAAEMRSLAEIAVGKHRCASQMHKPCAVGIFAGKLGNVVMSACAQ